MMLELGLSATFASERERKMIMKLDLILFARDTIT